MSKKLFIKFSILYSILGGIVLGSGFEIFFLRNPKVKHPLLHPFLKYTFFVAFLIGLILLIVQLHMVLKKKILPAVFIFSIIFGSFGAILFTYIWLMSIDWVSFLKEKYQILY